jgi:hypothetical protein
MKRILITAALLFATGNAFAESPYQGMQSRTVKALSEQQVADLNEGRGMGMALAAELNGYPGPSHVLELADKLELKSDQISAVRSLFESMKQESIPLGTKLIEQERELDRQFASRTVTPEILRAATAAIARTQGELRETHLKYHLSAAALLDPSRCSDISWDYTTWLNISFLILADLLVWRFLKTGGPAMLRMMNRPAAMGNAH